MQFNLLGRTGLIVSRLCLGTNTFGGDKSGRYATLGALDQKTASAIVGRAIESGINFIDTANVYANGGSELRVGQALRDLGIPRHSLVVATKVGLRMGPGHNAVGLSRAHIMAEADASLKRLATDYIDVYMLHRFDPLTPLDESLRALDDLVQGGKVRCVACSNFAAWQVMKGLGISERDRLARFEAVEAHYSIASRDIERELVPMMQDQRVGLMVWGPLVGGLLSGKIGRDGKGPGGTRLAGGVTTPVDLPRAFDIIDAMRPIAAAHGVSLARVALAWLLHQPWVSSVLFGATSVEQVEDNIAAADVRLTAADLAALERASALRTEYPAWMQKRLNADRPAPA
ncbi:MAG: aldo/keto reductase [Alphaproteobacteria bacterium]